jgi:hypothetical protein
MRRPRGPRPAGGDDRVEDDEEVDALFASLLRELFKSTQHLFAFA